MIEEVMAVIAIFGLLGIASLKLYNLTKLGRLYPTSAALITFIISLFFWGMLFIAFAGAMLFEQTIDTGAATYTITSNSYLVISLYMFVANLLITFSGLLTLFEVFMSLNPLLRKKRAKGARK